MRWGAVLLASALLAGCAARVPSPAAAPPAIDPVVETAASRPAPRRGTPLARFFDDLRRLEAGRLERVRIIQIGDSHTAGDVMSARLRSLFQDRFGDAGRGLMQPGIPYDGLRYREAGVSQSGRWAYDNSLRQAEAGPYGLAGFVARSRSPGAALTISANDAAGFDTASIDYMRMPGAGRLIVRADGRDLREVNTAGPAFALGTLDLPIPRGTREIELVSPDKRNIALLGWSLERKQRGVVYDSLGVSGATIGIVGRWNPEFVKRGLQARRPSLVVVAYGTNEGFAPELDPQRYAQQFAAHILAIQTAVPNAAILIVGPPDAQRADPSCARRGSGNCTWTTPEGIGVVRATQRAFAQRSGLAFWDWSAVMGGPGSMDGWTRRDPPLARADHVHMTRAGYELSAESLFNTLMRDYEAHKAIGPLRADSISEEPMRAQAGPDGAPG